MPSKKKGAEFETAMDKARDAMAIQGLYETRGIIEFEDGFKFNQVTKEYARDYWEEELIYGIDEVTESQHLIEYKQDLDDYELFGTEIGFAKGGELDAPNLIKSIIHKTK